MMGDDMKVGIFTLLLFVALGAQCESPSGFYVGVLGGIGKNTGKSSHEELNNIDVGGQSDVYGALFGYKAVFGTLTTAVEADYLKYSGELRVGLDNRNVHMAVKPEYAYTASILFGFMAADTVEVYLRGGYGQTHIESKVGTTANPTLHAKSNNFNTPVAGLGIRFSNETHLGFRLEFRHNIGETYKIADDSDFKSNNNLFLASLDYVF